MRQSSAAFRTVLDEALVEGRAILLIDGLDEIGDPGDRASFVCTLRSALLAYPQTSIVVTSREAGFRHVAAHLASICTSAKLSPFNSDDIQKLTVAWHKEVVGATEKIKLDAEALAISIAKTDRIARLATNPLLLTTLLLVKRWVGSLPTRRAVLYGKAVEVLLMTWNTEGHEPIRDEEALPQLCYVAAWMMMTKVERISRPKLSALLQEARESLPTELGYVKGTVEEFIHRVEDRSSLLMMTGHDVEDGLLSEFFEFRHLTFQEFLCARGMVEGWHPHRQDDDSLVEVLEPYIVEEKWREVIPLAAVLGGKATESLIQKMTSTLVAAQTKDATMATAYSISSTLGHSLADEAAARPETVRSAIQALVSIGLERQRNPSFVNSYVPALVTGRYGRELREETERAFENCGNDVQKAVSALKDVSWHSMLFRVQGDRQAILRSIEELLVDQTLLKRCSGALAFAAYSDTFPLNSTNELDLKQIDAIANKILDLMFTDVPAAQYTAGWALWALGRFNVWTPPSVPDAFGRMFYLWRNAQDANIRNGLSQTLTQQRFESREIYNAFNSVKPTYVQELFSKYNELDTLHEKPILLLAAYYLRCIGEEELIHRVLSLEDKSKKAPPNTTKPILDRRMQELLSLLGYLPSAAEDRPLRGRFYGKLGDLMTDGSQGSLI